MSKTVEVTIDSREDDIYNKTFRAHDQVDSHKVEMLEVGDFRVVPSDGDYDSPVVFERKTPGDFVGSMRNKRLEKQIKKMYEDVEPKNSFLVIEGDLASFEYMPHTKTTQKSIHGFIGALSARWQMVPLFCTDEVKLTDMVVRTSRKRFEDTTRIIRMTGSTPSVKNADFYDRAVVNLEGIGRTQGKRLKKEFPTFPELVQATEEELCEIDGIGWKTAESIVEQIQGKNAVA